MLSAAPAGRTATERGGGGNPSTLLRAGRRRRLKPGSHRTAEGSPLAGRGQVANLPHRDGQEEVCGPELPHPCQTAAGVGYWLLGRRGVGAKAPTQRVTAPQRCCAALSHRRDARGTGVVLGEGWGAGETEGDWGDSAGQETRSCPTDPPLRTEVSARRGVGRGGDGGALAASYPGRNLETPGGVSRCALPFPGRIRIS